MALVVAKPSIEAEEPIYRRQLDFFLNRPVFNNIIVGNHNEEDIYVTFEGSEQDYYIALDDSTNQFIIGVGNVVGSSAAIKVLIDRQLQFAGADILSTFYGPVKFGSGAEADIVTYFDGAEQDYYIGLDDSANTLVVGLGTVPGTTPVITINSNLGAAFAGAVGIAGLLSSTVAAGSPAIEYIKTTDVVTADPTTDAPNHWLQVKENAGATDYYIPVYTIDGA